MQRARALQTVLAVFLLCVESSSVAHAQRSVPHEEPVAPTARPRERSRARRLGLGTLRAAFSLVDHPPPPTWTNAVRGRSLRRFHPPIEGAPVTQDFHAQGGQHRALDLGARCETVIFAAHNGLVAYSGGGLHGMGNGVFLVGPGGWVTAYGHTRRNLVASGAIVRRGQPLALVGDSGDAHGCHLHFVAWRAGTRVDPALHLPRSAPRHRRAR